MTDNRPRIGITWGRQVAADSLAKLACYVQMVRAAGGEPVALVPASCLAAARANLPAAGLLPSPCPAGGKEVEPFAIEAGDDAVPQDFDGLLFAGGRDVAPEFYGETPSTPTLSIDPERDAFELPLARKTLAEGIPYFGICRGMQVLNVALGGALYQDIPTQHAPATSPLEHREGAFHDILVTPGSRLARLAGTDRLTTNSWHHQGVKLPEGLAPGLLATAVAPDGIVEACEASPGSLAGFVQAVQWHPERRIPEDSPAFAALSKRLFETFVVACAEARRPASPARQPIG